MILATNNVGKLNEIRKILDEYEIFSLKDKNINIDVVEDQDTFVDNAKKKAIEVYNLTHEEVIADDSGLCINVLDGFPGVMTHRFLGDDATDDDRNKFLVDKLNDYEDRSAFVLCNLVYYDGVDFVVGEGRLDGFISREVRGLNGFGFDSIFELSSGKTLAELSSDEKNNVSARYLAAQDLKNKLKK